MSGARLHTREKGTFGCLFLLRNDGWRLRSDVTSLWLQIEAIRRLVCMALSPGRAVVNEGGGRANARCRMDDFHAKLNNIDMKRLAI